MIKMTEEWTYQVEIVYLKTHKVHFKDMSILKIAHLMSYGMVKL